MVVVVPVKEDHRHADTFSMQIHSVGIDLGKTTFHLVAQGTAGNVLARKKFTQKQLLAYTANMQTSLIGMEACSGAHFLVTVSRTPSQPLFDRPQPWGRQPARR
jgi:hypothetical protein